MSVGQQRIQSKVNELGLLLAATYALSAQRWLRGGLT